MFEDASFGLASLKKQKLDKLTKEPFLIFKVCFKLYFGQKLKMLLVILSNTGSYSLLVVTNTYGAIP